MNQSQIALRDHLRVLSSFGMMPKSEEYNYTSMYDFVLDRGIPYDAETPLTKEEKQIIKTAAKRMGQKFELKQCFYNAQMLVLSDSSGELEYAEGWAHAGVFPVHHGWVILNGKVVDLTWRDQQGSCRVGRSLDVFAYLGVPIGKELIRSRIIKTGWASCVIDDYENHWPLLKWPRLNQDVS